MSAIDFEKVYHENFKIVYGFIYSRCKDAHIAEEITQETFFRALKSIDKFQGRSKESVWLCEIAKNTYFTYCRKNSKLTAGDEDMNKSITEDSTLEHYIDSEDADAIHRILHEIEEPYREVFSLRVFGELPYQKVGELFHKSESWARVTYYRAKQKIINRMEGK